MSNQKNNTKRSVLNIIKPSFWEKFRVPESTQQQDVSINQKTSGEKRKRKKIKENKRPMSAWQIFSAGVMIFLGLALVLSTILPYLG
tara:strand:- start:89 stop:349 length:261 start_codon:yes stop_codon:yes gene_type:complete